LHEWDAREMNRQNSSGKQRRVFAVSIIFILLLCPVIIFLLSSGAPVIVVKGTSYIPAPPEGVKFGFVNIDYEYCIMTLNPNATWRFDWGDGTITPWLHLEEGQTSINQTHCWNTSGNYQVRVQFKNAQIPTGVWSIPSTVSISEFSGADFPNPPILLSGTIQGFIGNFYYYTVITNDTQMNQVSYSFDWGNGVPSEWTSFISSTTESVFSHTWDAPGEYVIKVKARNQYNLESTWCDPLRITMKNITDIDGRTIDLIVLHGIDHHIMFTSENNGTFYNSSSGSSSAILLSGGGEYLIDDDNDGQWDYLYVPALGKIQEVVPKQIPLQKNFFSEVPWMFLLIIGSIILGIIGVILVLIKKGFIYIAEETISEK
jgi:PKD domain